MPGAAPLEVDARRSKPGVSPRPDHSTGATGLSPTKSRSDGGKSARTGAPMSKKRTELPAISWERSRRLPPPPPDLTGSLSPSSWRYIGASEARNAPDASPRQLEMPAPEAERPAASKMPWDPWMVAADGNGGEGAGAPIALSVGEPAPVRENYPRQTVRTTARAAQEKLGGARRFAYVLGAEGLPAAERTALLSPASTLGFNAAASTMLMALLEIQRSGRGGVSALLAACSHVQLALSATDVAVLLWRRPADERPTVLRPAEPPTGAHAARTVCNVLHSHPDLYALLSRCAVGRHVLNVWRLPEAVPQQRSAVAGLEEARRAAGDAHPTDSAATLGQFTTPRKVRLEQTPPPHLISLCPPPHPTNFAHPTAPTQRPPPNGPHPTAPTRRR